MMVAQIQPPQGINVNEHTVCDLLCCGNTSLLDSPSSSLIMTSATAGLMITRSSITGVVRSRKKFSMSSRIMSLVISTEKHCRRVVLENGPKSWLLIDVKSLVPGRTKTCHVICGESEFICILLECHSV